MKPSGGVPPLAALAVLLAVSLLPRLVTLRQGTLPSGAMVYFHDEGDEMVFKTLVDPLDALRRRRRAISRRPSGSSLSGRR